MYVLKFLVTGILITIFQTLVIPRVGAGEFAGRSLAWPNQARSSKRKATAIRIGPGSYWAVVVLVLVLGLGLGLHETAVDISVRAAL
jgi:hypothetical protein